jgi:hypothetical protein
LSYCNLILSAENNPLRDRFRDFLSTLVEVEVPKAVSRTDAVIRAASRFGKSRAWAYNVLARSPSVSIDIEDLATGMLLRERLLGPREEYVMADRRALLEWKP